KKMSTLKRKQIESLANTIYVSSISITEIMIKASIGKLKVDYNPVAIAEESGFELLDWKANDALILKDLPFHHKDPFDRMLISQSITNSIPIMTDDEKFEKYDCVLLG
ncbi:MAG: type II toxin-antitoxin system VapC family toxin, partial [Candidatus Marinimicrobia bacterium]|nr:type II toxin-antitoxin system VapC family toxin [Candidatus Neomarinimicrobiota bacterium]